MTTRELWLERMNAAFAVQQRPGDGKEDDRDELEGDITLAEPVCGALETRSQREPARPRRPRPRTHHSRTGARESVVARAARRRIGAFSSIDDAIAWTPMVRLSRIGHGHPCTPLAKCAFMAQPGTLDFHAAMAILRRAESRGRTRPGDTIVAPCRGDSAVGLAMAAAVGGYHLVITTPLSVELHEQTAVEALGARVIRTPSDVEPDARTGYIGVARRVCRALPNAHLIRSWSRPLPLCAPEALLAREVVQQCGHDVDIVVVPSSHPGEVAALARALQGAAPRAHVIEVVVGASDTGGTMSCSLENATAVSDRLARHEGLLVGPRSAGAAWAALEVCRELSSSHTVVAMLDDRFCASAEIVARPSERRCRELGTALDVATAVAGEDLIHLGVDDSVATALHLLRRHDVSHLPVLEGDQLAGVVSRGDIVRQLESGNASRGTWVRDVMMTGVPTVSVAAHASELFPLLERDELVAVTDDACRVFGVVTRGNLAAHLGSERSHV